MKLKSILTFLFLAVPSLLLAQEATSEFDVTPLVPAIAMLFNALVIVFATQGLKRWWPALKQKQPIVAQLMVMSFGMLIPLIEQSLFAWLGAQVDLSPILEVLNGIGTPELVQSGLTSALAGIGTFHLVRENSAKRKG